MENISCMRVKCFKYLDGFLTGIEETYTDKNDKSFRISRSARNDCRSSNPYRFKSRGYL